MHKRLKFPGKIILTPIVAALMMVTQSACNDGGKAKIGAGGGGPKPPGPTKPTPDQLAVELTGMHGLVLLSSLSVLQTTTHQVAKADKKYNPRDCVSGPEVQQVEQRVFHTYTWRCFPKTLHTSGAEGDLSFEFLYDSSDEANKDPLRNKAKKITLTSSDDFAFYYLGRAKSLQRWPAELVATWQPQEANTYAVDFRLNLVQVRDPNMKSNLRHSWFTRLKGSLGAAASKDEGRPFAAQIVQMDFKSQSTTKTFDLSQLDLAPRETIQFKPCGLPIADFNFFFQSSALGKEIKGTLASEEKGLKVNKASKYQWGKCSPIHFTYVNEFSKALLQLSKRIRTKGNEGKPAFTDKVMTPPVQFGVSSGS